MSTYDIAVIPGDGVGREVGDEAMKALTAAAAVFGFGIKTEAFPWGCDYYLQHGRMMPPDALETLQDFDAIFLGCIGDAQKVADHVSLQLLLQIRKGFDQYVNLRPIKLFPGVDTPLKTAAPESVDLVVVRENTEGEYSALGGFFKQGTPDAFALQTAVFTRKGCERVMRYAFDLAAARKRSGGKTARGKVTNCTKSNALNFSMVFWDQTFREVAADYPQIQTDAALVDALTMWLVKNPESFDVVVASNLFGDIITDLGAMLQGGMGFAAGGNINPEKRYPSMFEPIHGSAPKYAGKGVVNPVAAICSAAMLADQLGQKRAAAAIEDTVCAVLAAGRIRTKDMGGGAGTAEMGDAIARRIHRRGDAVA
jgi:tartrate dehydrogenase/decarboxylase/D-malate dehydrogenase